MEFEITPIDPAEGIRGLRVEGEVDLLAAPVLKQELGALIGAGAAFLIVDLSEATFLDSTALGVFIGANRRVLLEDGVLMIVCNNPTIRTIFSLTLLDRIFDLFDTLDDAVAALEALREAREADSLA
jgi:anti-sigma B factor antagonist